MPCSSSPLVAAAVLLGALTPLAAQTAPATGPTTGPAMPVEQVFRIRLHQGWVELESDLPRSTGPFVMPIRVDGLPGLTTVRWERDEDGELKLLKLTNVQDPANSDGHRIATTVHYGSSLLQIDRETTTPGGSRMKVSLLQRYAGEAEVWLSAERARPRLLHRTPKLDSTHCKGRDYAELCGQYPREVQEHLRPLLAAVSQQAFFAGDELALAQVFAREFQIPDYRKARIARLLADLDAGGDKGRTAEEQLGSSWRELFLAMPRADLSRLSPAQRKVVAELLKRAPRLGAQEIDRRRSDPLFLVDCLYSDQAPIRAAAHRMLEQLAGRKLQFDPVAPRAARSAQADAIRAELTR